jgi:hypothetical protein
VFEIAWKIQDAKLLRYIDTVKLAHFALNVEDTIAVAA